MPRISSTPKSGTPDRFHVLFDLNHDEDDRDVLARTATPAYITLESLFISEPENASDQPCVVKNDGVVDRLGVITTVLVSFAWTPLRCSLRNGTVKTVRAKLSRRSLTLRFPRSKATGWKF